MEYRELYEKISQYKEEGLEDSSIILRLTDSNTELTSILKGISEYDNKKRVSTILDDFFPRYICY